MHADAKRHQATQDQTDRRWLRSGRIRRAFPEVQIAHRVGLGLASKLIQGIRWNGPEYIGQHGDTGEWLACEEAEEAIRERSLHAIANRRGTIEAHIGAEHNAAIFRADRAVIKRRPKSVGGARTEERLGLPIPHPIAILRTLAG